MYASTSVDAAWPTVLFLAILISPFVRGGNGHRINASNGFMAYAPAADALVEPWHICDVAIPGAYYHKSGTASQAIVNPLMAVMYYSTEP